MDEWKKTALERAEQEAQSELERIAFIANGLKVNGAWLAGEVIKAMKKRLEELKNQ